MKDFLKLMIVVALVLFAGSTHGSGPVQDSILLMEYLNQPFPDSVRYVKVEEDSILVEGRFSNAVPYGRVLCEISLWEHPCSMDNFSSIFPLPASEDTFQLRIPRQYMLDGIKTDRLYSRWAIATGSEGNYDLTSHARSAGDVFDIAQWYSDEEYPATIKGMGGISWQPGQIYDLNGLGVKCITINQLLHALISLTPTSSVHVYNGKSYYINSAQTDRLDNLLNFCNDNDIIASITHHWNYSKNYFRPREFLEHMLKITEKEGDFEWGLAYHPYPRQLTKPKTWNDADVDWTDSKDYLSLDKNDQLLFCLNN